MTASTSKISQTVRLMIVDDDTSLRLVLRQQFEAEGLRIIQEADSLSTSLSYDC